MGKTKENHSMKKMKFLTGLGAFIVALSTPLITTVTVTAPVVLTGCGTLGGGGTNDSAQVDAAALILENTARSGVIAAITPPTGDTNNAKYFDLASQAIGLFLTGTNYSPAAFQKALTDIKIPQATNVWVQLGIGAAIDLYQVYFSQYVSGKVNGDYAAGTLLQAVQRGFNEALGLPAAAPPAGLRATRNRVSAPVSVLPRPLKR